MRAASADVFSQRHQYILMRSNLRPRQLLVLMDFTSASLADKPGAGTVVQDCIVVMEYRDANNSVVRRNFDFLCASNTNQHDYHFVLQVWVWLFLHEHLNDRFSEMDVWTDGGPHHFKTRFCQFMWHILSSLRFSQKRISHHFFAAYHGHSLADGHAAIIKRALYTQYNVSEHERNHSVPSATFGPATVEEVAVTVRKDCKNTTVTVFTDIEREDKIKQQIKAIHRIKDRHSFTFCAGVCYAQNQTNDDLRFQFEF
jgi:hypothetical protein